MPKGPQGQKRPADAVACAVAVARIATGEIEDEIEISGRVGGKTAGGVARAAKLAPDVRANIAGEAARARWSQRETGDMTMQTTKGTGADGREAVRMYPNNQLGPQQKELDNAFSGFAMLRDHFKK